MGEFETTPVASNDYLTLIFPPEWVLEQGGIKSGNEYQFARFLTSYTNLLKDSPLLPSHGPKPRRLVRWFFTHLAKRGIQGIKELADLGDSLNKSVKQTPLGTRQGFLKGLEKTPVFQEYLHFFRTGDTACYRFVLSFLWFGKKLDYVDDTFDATALRRWRQVEDELANLVLPDEVSDLRHILSTVLPPLDRTNLFPKFGSGHVAEKGVFGHIEKTVIDYDRKLDWVFFRESPFTTKTMIEEQGFRITSVIPSETEWSSELSQSITHSRVKFVPKNIKTSRTICMEPNGYMFFQQALMRWMVDAIDNSELRKFIHLRDQDVNRQLCEYGALTGRIDTLDQSDASDRVSVKLVKAIFPRDWLYYMMGTRTSSVLIDGSVVQVNKFAPMGSAICFPTQCIIYACVVLQAAMYEMFGNERYSLEQVTRMIPRVIEALTTGNLHSGLLPLSVFGDDVCVDSTLTPTVALLLSKYGFKLNLDKSFTGDDAFRESCGKYYLGGDDVTPEMYRVDNAGSQLSAGNIANLIGLIDSSTYGHYRKYLIEVLLRHNPATPFLTRDTQGSVRTDEKTDGRTSNAHLKSRWNRDLQRREVRARVPVKRVETYPESPSEVNRVEKYLYMRWKGSTPLRVDELPNRQSLRGVAESEIRMVWRWTPDY